MSEPATRETFQEEIVTQRNDRFVLPVKAELQSRMEGIIHDASASRRTVFLEPLSIVPKNNQLGLLAAEERREVIRILIELTGRVRVVWPGLKIQIAAAARLDCLQARARLGRRLGAVRPEIDPRRIKIESAKHPLLLLSGERTIPVDLQFPEGKSVLIILRAQRRRQDRGPEDPGVAPPHGPLRGCWSRPPRARGSPSANVFSP